MQMTVSRLRESGANLHGDSGSAMDVMPEWMDRQRFDRGRTFFARHLASITTALHCSLTVGFALVNLLEPLVFTHKSDTPQTSLVRYLQTYAHLVLWHVGDVWEVGSPAYKSVVAVRRMHARVRRAMNKDRDPSTTDHLYLSQYDMGLVQSGFMGIVVMYPTEFGIRCTLAEIEDYVFFWRGIGYLLGIDDSHNICSGDYLHTYTVCKDIEQQLVLPGLRRPPAEFSRMADAYIDGVNLVAHFELNTKESVISFALGIVNEPWPSLRWKDTLRVWSMKMTIALIRWVPGVRVLFNVLSMTIYKYCLPLIEKQLGSYKDHME